MACLLHILTIISVLCFAACGAKLFRYDYTYHPNVDGWLKLHVIPATWRDAWLTCDLEGSVLVSPTDLNMILAMGNHSKSLNTTPRAFYTGVHATFSKRQFSSIEGVPLAKMPVKWAAGEPNNVNNSEECLTWNDGTVADVYCSSFFPFMCFKKNAEDMVMTACGTVDKEYELNPLTGNCYKFHRHGRTWSKAHMACAAEGGYLAVINSEDEAQTLRNVFNRNYLKISPGSTTNQIYIGMHDWGDTGVWRTIHGLKIEDAGYAKWTPNQPNNVERGQHCGTMYNTTKLNDFWCDRLLPYICEKSPNSLMDNVI